MTLLEQEQLDTLSQKQIADEIHQPELRGMVKIRAQMEDTLNNSQLTATEKLDILKPAQDNYNKVEESVRPAKMPFMG